VVLQRPFDAPNAGSSSTANGELMLTATRVVIASRRDRLADVQKLVDLGAEIEAACNQGSTALSWASFRGHEQVARFLLDRHADIETRNNKGFTPLVCASQEGHVPVIELLLTRLANIEAKNNQGIAALAEACIKGHVPAATLLLDKHADIESRCNYGFSPLMYAIQNKHVPMIELLCNRHAAIDVLDGNNRSALGLACFLASVDAVRALLARGANVDLGVPSPTILACVELHEDHRKGQDMSTFWARRREIVIELVCANSNLDVVWQGHTPLQLARYYKQPAIAVVLEMALSI